jgi:AcrR family transcriptional regulator
LRTEAGGTRRHILEAAEGLILERGLGACTTRAIAERAGCAEGSIYRHFSGKAALVVECIRARFPAFIELVASLPGRAGVGTVRATLEEVAANALEFYRAAVPLVSGPMADHDLLLEQRRHYKATSTGPMPMFADLSRYLRAEQALGRISAEVSPDHVTRMLLGTCFAQAFVEILVGDDARLGDDHRFVTASVGSLMAGLDPPAPTG